MCAHTPSLVMHSCPDRSPHMDALVRIRVLRRDGYRCMARTTGRAVCGRPAPYVGKDADEVVALCPVHAPDQVR